jgi:hypothetical protein
MSEPDPAPLYQVHASAAVLEMIRQIQRQAEREGRGPLALAALREIERRLQREAGDLGEPTYRLPSLQLQMRTCAVGPLLVDFAVHENKPVVFVKGMKLLSRRRS